jgi:hypothetical protein
MDSPSSAHASASRGDFNETGHSNSAARAENGRCRKQAKRDDSDEDVELPGT